MTQTLGPQAVTQLPDHTQLPETDGIPVKNFQEHPQTRLLTDAIEPVLDALHPDKQYTIGQDSGIYWRYDAEDPLRGCIAPDWFYVPNVPPDLDGQFRRSYVMWKENVTPMLAIELSSGDGSEERDTTPPKEGEKPGKFWVYERILHIPYYGIYIKTKGQLEMYHWQDLKYRRMTSDAAGRYPIEPLGVALGIWHGLYHNRTIDWIRWWDLDGNLLLTGAERAEAERERAEAERARAERAEQNATQAQEKADRLAERLRALGIGPDEL